ncbi:hypothetical protein WH52_10985 [Tenacibaculum holothuriorum]|uniref:TonB-dependent receptor n=1 Tax=Tenacibaculum holothuriorum TaxID=1635173 RepID=A0A1Y2PCJ8_9FLAO|nr:TonB-dependent receptor [Tenacibaculum holothuriorum]OSY87398.1 hypothetical protein WH52_10985 [Tenacibaculum holothuriorum]
MKHNFLSLRKTLFLLTFLSSFSLLAQTTLKGKVLDKTTNEPLPGASVMVKGSYSGSTTDFDGNFTFSTKHPLPLTLNVTFVGYNSKELTVTNANEEIVVALEYGNTLNEVVVTSQLREQKLQEVPIAVSVFDASRVEAKPNINNVEGIMNEIPGLTGGITPGAVVYNIRGISSNIFHNSIENSVGIFTDGFFSGRLTAGGNEFFDIERIEVLKGPQGTLFGRNTSAGAISINTNSAKFYEDAKLAFTFGNEGQFTADYMINLPLSDKFTFRFSGRKQTRNGLIEATNIKDNSITQLGKVDLKANRLGLNYVSEFFSADLKVTHTDSDRGGAPFVSIADNDIMKTQITALNIANGQFSTFSFAPDGISVIAPNTDKFRRKTKISAPSADNSQNTTATLKLVGFLSENLSLESISAYNNNKLTFITDIDQTAFDFTSIESIDEFETYNQEIRLKGSNDKLDWLAAVNVFYQTSDQQNNLFGNDAQFDKFISYSLGPVPLGGGFSANILNGWTSNDWKENTLHTSKIFSSSVFADATWHATEKIDVTAGFRVSYDKKKLRYFAKLGTGQYHQNNGAFNPPTNTPFNFLTFGERLGAADNNTEQTWVAFQPRLNVAYKFTKDLMVFGGYSRGYKPGGFGYYILEEVKPETNNAFEIGTKYNFPEGRGFINVSAYYYDYNNLQVEDISGPRTAIINASKSTSKGIEIETAYNILQELTIGGSLSYVDAKFKDFTTVETIFPPTGGPAIVNNIDYSGNRLAYTPELTFNAFLAYEKYFSNQTTSFFVQADYYHQGDQFFHQRNDPNLKGEAYGLLNGSIGFNGLANGRFNVSVFANNILDKEYLTVARANGALGAGAEFPYVSRGLPLIAGVRLKINNIFQ